MTELAEITYALGRLQAELEDLAVGGLRVSGPERLPVLRAVQEDLAQVGASHLASRLGALVEAVSGDRREAAAALARTQASLRVFERVLTLEVAAGQLRTLAGAIEGPDGDSEGEPA